MKTSVINWQTGEPKKEGLYLVTIKGGHVMTSHFLFYHGFKCWAFGLGNVTAWCKLSDIEPYKKEEV